MFKKSFLVIFLMSFCNISFANETVNVFDFTRFLQTAGQTVVLPIILKTNSYLFFKEWILNKQLTSGKFGIKVPSGKFLLKPKKYIAGTKMNYNGIKKDQDRADLIKWLSSLSD